MDSRKMRRMLIALIVMFVVLIGVITVTNLDTVMGKLGLTADEQVEETTDIEGHENGGQRGSDLSAFLYDETFFDPEVKFKSIESYSGRRVFLVMSSVAKDLRVMIVDSVGRLVTGTPFTIRIQGVGEYTDTDEDGIIYLDGLRSGEYSVVLEEAEGYIVPNTITSIQVRQDIEYRVIDDIEYMILTEDDVDVNKEDKAVNGAEEAADGSENTDLEFASASGRLGIDVSRWNETIDWEKVKEDGIEFAIVRCGYRGASSGALVLDSMYEDNIKGAIEAGIPVGVYFFTQATSEVEAVEEASMVISLIEDYDVDYPVFLDSESAGGSGRADGLDMDERVQYHKAFLETIASAGYETGIYASKNWLNDQLDMTQLSQYKTWLAEYADVPTYDKYFDMWQYTSKGTVDGIGTRVDLNVSYMNIDTSINHAKGAAGYSGVINGDSGNVPTGSDED